MSHEDPTRRLVARLRHLRRAAGLRQADVAARLHTAQHTVANWENSRRTPALVDVERWATAVGGELVIGIRTPSGGGTQ